MSKSLNRIVWTILTLAASSSAMGCGDDRQLFQLDSGLFDGGNDDGGFDASVSPGDRLQGVWEGACIPGGSSNIDAGSDVDAGVGDATRQGFAFNGDQFVTRIERYFDSTCATPVLRIEIGGTFTVGDLVDPANGVYAINITVTTLSAQVASADLVDLANAEAILGFTDWQAGVARNVLGLDVFGTGTPIEANDVIYQIFQVIRVFTADIELPILYFGNETGSGPILSEAQRPTTLSQAPHAYGGAVQN